MIAFIIWALAGCLFIGLGVKCFLSKKAAGFWANVKMFEVTDIRGYNRAMGKLWCVFGFGFILLGLPLLAGQNSPLAVISVLGIPALVIILMILYELVIRRKYEKRS